MAAIVPVDAPQVHYLQVLRDLHPCTVLLDPLPALELEDALDDIVLVCVEFVRVVLVQQIGERVPPAIGLACDEAATGQILLYGFVQLMPTMLELNLSHARERLEVILALLSHNFGVASTHLRISLLDELDPHLPGVRAAAEHQSLILVDDDALIDDHVCGPHNTLCVSQEEAEAIDALRSVLVENRRVNTFRAAGGESLVQRHTAVNIVALWTAKHELLPRRNVTERIIERTKQARAVDLAV